MNSVFKCFAFLTLPLFCGGAFAQAGFYEHVHAESRRIEEQVKLMEQNLRFGDLPVERKVVGDDFVYRLDWKKELAISAGGIASLVIPYALGTRIPPDSAYISQLNVNDLPAIDRYAVYQRDGTAGKVSDVLQNVFVGAGVLYTGFATRWKLRNWGTMMAMYAEAFVWNLGITTSFKYAVARPRPYTYREEFLVNTNGRVGSSDMHSHISGHTSTVFMCAAFISKTYSDLFPNSQGKIGVWTMTMSLAAFTGYLRIAAGAHYFTDVLHGAAWGTLVGYLIPVLHKKPISLGRKKQTQLKLRPWGGKGFYGMSANMTWH